MYAKPIILSKRITISLLFISLLTVLNGQVRVYPVAEAGYEQRIKDYIESMSIVDTHEHLVSQKGIGQSGMLDFMLLFHQYADDDIKSSGMSKPTFETLLKDSLTVSQKWTVMKPFYESSFNTSYNKVALLSAINLFGIDNFDNQSVLVLSDNIKKAYQTDWYRTVLKEKCRIDFLINDDPNRNFGDTSMMRYTKKFNYFQIDSKATLDLLSKTQGAAIQSLNDLVRSMNSEFEKAIKEGFASIKTSVAYFRSLYFEDVGRQKAEEVFTLVFNHQGKPLSFETIKPLSDYMMHRLLDLARKYQKPIQIHTGLQAGDGNTIQNSNPALLANLFLKYRDVRFVLFHGGYPYGGELASLAKNFRNVYIDLCWVYIISPSYSIRYLNEWLETIPANKIMAFGGDYENVENIYGHLLFAKQIIVKVLTDKVKDGYFSEKEAIKVASMILHDNAVSLYQLKH